MVIGTDPPFDASPHQSRHLDCRIIYDLCSDPAIVDRMASFYGPDLVLWRSNIFVKDHGGSETGWHQDMNYWPIEPLINISAWLAIDDVDQENGCANLIPGFHRKAIPHITAPLDKGFREIAAPSFVDDSNAVAMPLKAGEFFLFNERTLHQSNKMSLIDAGWAWLSG